MLTPHGKNCCVCNLPQTPDENFVIGYIGIIPVAFCPNCYGGIVNMVISLEDLNYSEDTYQ
jgi:hypothetical protein